MINMMYLVLTAILALNVSAEILQAFESLRSSLETSASGQAKLNVNLTADIIKAIDNEVKNGNEKHLYIKPMIQDVNTEANEMINYLNEITEQLEVFGKKDGVTGEIISKDEQDLNYAYWLGTDDLANDGRGNGMGVELHEKLDQYVAWANKFYAAIDSSDPSVKHFARLAIEPKDDPSITDPDSKAKTWEYHSFHNKPVVADLAMIGKFKLDIREVQSAMLNKLKNQVKDYVFTVDKLLAVDAPVSQVVAAGMKYETKLAVGVSSSSIKPEFMGNGIRLDEGGSTATMTIPANGSVIPNGKSEGIQHYRAMIKVPKADGSFEELPVEGSFVVRKPEVIVRSKALQLLYKDCGNQVVVDVPALGDSYNPDFSRSTGGQVIKSQRSRKDITIIPTARQFKLSVYSNTNGQSVKIDQLNYRVVKPPEPKIVVEYMGRPLMPAQAVSKRGKIKVKLDVDTEFAANLPKDARYKATKVKLMYQDGLNPPRTVKEYSGARIQRGIDINLYQGAIKNAYDGARIFIEVEGLTRKNYRGRNLGTGLSRYELVIPAIVKG